MRTHAARLALVLSTCLPSMLLAAEGGVERSAEAPTDPVATILRYEDRREAVPELLRYLRHEKPELRARAALAVGRIGRAEDVPVLASLLPDADADVRRATIFALGEIADSTAAEPIAAHVKAGEEDAGARELAADALGKLGRGGDACTLLLEDEDARVRARALLAAWRMPVPGAFEHALDALASEDVELRWPAAYCLMRLLGAPPSGRTAIPDAGEISDEDRERGRDALLEAATDADPRVRLQALRGLRTFGDGAVTAVLRATSDDGDWRVRVEGARALAASVRTTDGTAPRDVDIDALAPFLADDAPNVRVTAIEALENVGAPADAVARLEALLEDPLPRTRQAALTTLIARWSEKEPPPETIARICDRMLAEDEWTLRALVPDAAALLPPESRLPYLRRVVDDPDTRVAKLGVAPYLTDLAQPDSTAPSLMPRIAPELARLSTSSDPMVTLMAVATAGELFADTLQALTDSDWRELERYLASTYAITIQDPANADIRQAIVGAAAPFAEARPAMLRILESACTDPIYVVRRDAVEAIEAIDGATPPCTAEPIETGRTLEDYRAVLDWAAKPHWAIIETVRGRVVLRLFSEDAPLTCRNFATLANDGFYDDGAWHRVVPDFVLQDGCPRGDGWGGPDHQIRCEINRHRYERGALGMALSGKDTGGSQFFITHAAQPHLDGGYTVFGEVVEGMSIADEIVQLDGIRTIRVVDEAPR